MRLTLLGTGPALPIPRFFCRCATCQDARQSKSKTKRMRSAALLIIGGRPASRSAARPFGAGAPVNSAGKHILFDCGPDILKQLEIAKVSTIDAVFLTHAHNDAAGGLFELNDILKRKYPCVFYVENGTAKHLDYFFNQAKDYFNVETIKSGQTLKIFGVKITPFRVLHTKTNLFPTLGYRLDNKMVYASDFRALPKESEHFLKKIPCAVLDGCAWFNKGNIFTHQNTGQSITLAEQLGIKELFLTQISHSYPPFGVASREIEKYCRKNKICTKVRLAYDGLEITI